MGRVSGEREREREILDERSAHMATQRNEKGKTKIFMNDPIHIKKYGSHK